MKLAHRRKYQRQDCHYGSHQRQRGHGAGRDALDVVHDLKRHGECRHKKRQRDRIGHGVLHVESAHGDQDAGEQADHERHCDDGTDRCVDILRSLNDQRKHAHKDAQRRSGRSELLERDERQRRHSCREDTNSHGYRDERTLGLLGTLTRSDHSRHEERQESNGDDALGKSSGIDGAEKYSHAGKNRHGRRNQQKARADLDEIGLAEFADEFHDGDDTEHQSRHLGHGTEAIIECRSIDTGKRHGNASQNGNRSRDLQKRITNLSDLLTGDDLGGSDQSDDEQTERSRCDDPLSKGPRVDTAEHTADQSHDADGGGQLQHGRTDLVDRSANRTDDSANGYHSRHHQRDHAECVDGLLDLTGVHTADDADGHRSQQERRGKLRHHLADAGEVDTLTEDAADEHDIGQKQLEPLHDLNALIERLVVERTHDLHGDRQQSEGSTDRQHQTVDRGDVLERSELELAHDRAQTNHGASHERHTTGNGSNGSHSLPHLIGVNKRQGGNSTSYDRHGFGNGLEAVGDVQELGSLGVSGEYIDGFGDRRQHIANALGRSGNIRRRLAELLQGFGKLEQYCQGSGADTGHRNGAPIDVGQRIAQRRAHCRNEIDNRSKRAGHAIIQALHDVLTDVEHHG